MDAATVTVLIIDPNQARQLNASKWIKELLLSAFQTTYSVILISKAEEFDHLHLLSECILVLHGESLTEVARSDLTATICTAVDKNSIHYVSYETSRSQLKTSIDSILSSLTLPPTAALIGSKRKHDDETSSVTTPSDTSANYVNYTNGGTKEGLFPYLRFLTQVAKLVVSYNSRTHTASILFASEIARNHFQLSMSHNRSWGLFSDLFGPGTCPSVARNVLMATTQKHQSQGFYINLYSIIDKCPRSSYVTVSSGRAEGIREGIASTEHLAVFLICSAGAVGSARLQAQRQTLLDEQSTPRSVTSDNDSILHQATINDIHRDGVRIPRLFSSENSALSSPYQCDFLSPVGVPAIEDLK